jgi:thymidine kinase
MKKAKKGKLEVICGSMFSGKSEELLYRLRRAEYAKKKVLTVKPAIDIRKSVSCIVCHSGGQREAMPIGSCSESPRKILGLVDASIDVVGIDEVQFFPLEIIPVICSLLEQGKRVISAGLDLDFRGEPFGVMPSLLALADEVVKLRAICMGCGDEANFSQRLINGLPARYDDPTILVGGEECYEARCRECFEIDRKAFATVG